jgi:hypothetical protein
LQNGLEPSISINYSWRHPQDNSCQTNEVIRSNGRNTVDAVMVSDAVFLTDSVETGGLLQLPAALHLAAPKRQLGSRKRAYSAVFATLSFLVKNIVIMN